MLLAREQILATLCAEENAACWLLSLAERLMLQVLASMALAQQRVGALCLPAAPASTT